MVKTARFKASNVSELASTGILRHTRNIDIISDTRFSKANEMFRAVATRTRKIGKGTTKPKQPIHPDDLLKIANYFRNDYMNDVNPRKFQKIVIFCRRGRENLYDMTLDQFEVATEPDGTRYVYQALDEFDKNHRDEEAEEANSARMFESRGT